MFKFKVITDSTTGLTQEEIKDLDVTVLPLTLSYDGKDYRDGIDINTDDFYDMVFKSQEKKGLRRFDFLGLLKRDSKEFPKTSMVSPGVFAEAYEKILVKGYIPVVFTITSVLSGTYQSAVVAKDMIDDGDKVIVIDSCTALGSVKVMIKALLSEEYETKEDLLNKIDYLKKHVNYLAVMDTLVYLYKGGRMGRFSSMFGNFLHFKPIMQLDYRGVITPVEKPRGLKHAFKGINDLLDKDPIDFNYPVEFGYSTQIENVKCLIESCKPHLKGEYTLCQISPVIGAYVGPGASALFYISTHEVDKKLTKE